MTLRHLLGHTSGIVDLTEMPELRAMQLMRNPTVTRDDVYKVISAIRSCSRQGRCRSTATPVLAPRSHRREGERDDLRGLRREAIFEPLGMSRSMYCNNSENVPRRAYGYGMRNGMTAPRAADRAHRDLRRRRDLLDGGGHDHVAAGAARRQGAVAEVVRRDDRRRRSSTTARPSATRWGSRRARIVTASGSSAMTAAASASRRRRGGIPTRSWRSSS